MSTVVDKVVVSDIGTDCESVGREVGVGIDSVVPVLVETSRMLFLDLKHGTLAARPIKKYDLAKMGLIMWIRKEMSYACAPILIFQCLISEFLALYLWEIVTNSESAPCVALFVNFNLSSRQRYDITPAIIVRRLFWPSNGT